MVKWIWLIVIVLALIIEAMGPQIVSIWFAVGGVAAFILSLCGLDVSVQIIAFVAVTVVSLIATKPIVAKLRKTDNTPTNADRYVGMEGKIIVPISVIEGTGRVLVSGSDWSAISDEDIPKDTLVRVEAIEGVKLRVKRIDGKE